MTHGPSSSMHELEYKRQEETIRQVLLAKFLHAMKEDLGEWISSLSYNVQVTPDSFMKALENGVILCQHARHIQRYAEEYAILNKEKNIKIPSKEVRYTEKGALPKSFVARDNVANFITWCRELGIPQVVMFETEDLVSHKNEKSVILTLLDVARKAYEFGVEPPELIRFEHEIDAEIERDKENERLGKPVPKPINMEEFNNLDAMVKNIVNQCTCFDRFPIKKLAEGKYQLGKNDTLIFVRIMRKNVMVRVGGGWDTLDHYITKHDPCRTKVAGNVDKESRNQTAPAQKIIDESPRRRNTIQNGDRESIKTNRLSIVSSDAWSLCSGSSSSSMSTDGILKNTCDCDNSGKSSCQSSTGKSSVLSRSNSSHMEESEHSPSFTKSIEDLDSKLQQLQNRRHFDLTMKDTSIYENKADRWLRQQMNNIKQRRVSDVENLSPMDEFTLRRGYTADLIERSEETERRKGYLTPKTEKKVSRTSSQPRLRSKTSPLNINNSYENDLNQSFQKLPYKQRQNNDTIRRSSSSLSNVSVLSEPSKQCCDTGTQTEMNFSSPVPKALIRKRSETNNVHSKIPRPTFQRSRTMENMSTAKMRRRNLDNKNTPTLSREKSDLSSIRSTMRREKSDLTGRYSLSRQQKSPSASKRQQKRTETAL